jgi:hypothetical protein
MTTAKYLDEISVAMRAKTGIIWVQSREELRIERSLIPIADDQSYELWDWTVTRGIKQVGIKDQVSREETNLLDGALGALMDMESRAILICQDAAAWLRDPVTLRKARDVHAELQGLPTDRAKQIIIVDQAAPVEGMEWVTFVECPLPNRGEMDAILESFLSWAQEDAVKDVKKNGNRESLVGAMLGLTAEDASNALARSLASESRFDTQMIAKEKARVVKGSGLEWYDPDPRGLDAVGGMGALKEWLGRRKKAFGKDARAFGLPAPRGVLLVGIPGGGKSLTAKCVSTAWGLPLLRMDVGSLFSKFVGDSETKIRQALDTAETIAPAVLWVDEIEKAFSSGGGESDGGTSSRVFGTFLTWMQERKEGVFIIATSNDISKLPPEFLRAGRWDELWFVDLPSLDERRAIGEVMIAKYEAAKNVDSAIVAKSCDGYTGAEIEQAFIDAMYVAFDESAEVSTDHVVDALSRRIPLSTSMKEKIDGLRKWAAGRARTASITETVAQAAGRSIE